MTNIFTVLITILPFIVWKGYFEGPKVFIFMILGLLLSLYWIYRLIKNPHFLKLGKKDLWFWIWLLILTISSVFGVHPVDSILGGSYRHQGVIFFLTLWLVGKTVGILDIKKKKLLYKGIGFAIIAECLIVFYQIVFGKLYLGKPLGTLGEPNAVAGMLAIGSYFVFVNFPKFIALLPILVIFITQSRSGVLALLPNLGLLMGSFGKRAKMLLITFIVILSGFVFLYLSTLKGSSYFENRQLIWPLAFKQIIKKPILGFGAESGESVFNLAYYQSGFPLSELVVDRAHNLFLDVAMWSGTLGLLAFVGWLYFSFLDLKKIGKKLAFLTFMIYSFFQPISVVHWLLFVILL